MILAILFGIFAVIGLLLVILDFGAKSNSPAPSMYNSDITGVGCLIFIVCGAISLACLASFGIAR